MPTIAVVGYTNAGKSTLLNQLTSSAVVAEDALFATLDEYTLADLVCAPRSLNALLVRG